MSFNELRLSEPIVRAIAAEGYTIPTPIQTKAIPEVLAGNDVLGCAQTGTGKTGAFAMPILDRLTASGSRRSTRNKPRGRGRRNHDVNTPRVLVLCPTRELATQIYESFRTYGRHMHHRHTVIFGGVNQNRQVRDLQRGVDVIVATPGRLLDLINQGFVDLHAIQTLVLDEADRMLDMGFIHDIRKIIKKLPARRQTLLFSATMPPDIRQLADTILHQPVFIQVDPVASPAESISQSLYMVNRKNKPVLLGRLLHREPMGRTLVFTRTKHGADHLVKTLRKIGIKADAIHGNKSQNARTRTLDSFKTGRVPVLIATDIASRGIDVDEITHVVNYDIPHIPETYVHRIGRTARAGASGIAFSFCDHEEISDLRSIERLIGMELDVIENESDLIFDATRTSSKQSRRKPGSRPAKPASTRSRSRNGRSRHSGNSGWSSRNSSGSRTRNSVKRQRRRRGVTSS